VKDWGNPNTYNENQCGSNEPVKPVKPSGPQKWWETLIGVLIVIAFVGGAVWWLIQRYNS